MGSQSVPNWLHHSSKEKKRTLRPQALRDARRRRQALKAKLIPPTSSCPPKA